MINIHVCIQWDTFTVDTIETQLTVLISEVSLNSGVVLNIFATIGIPESVPYFRVRGAIVHTHTLYSRHSNIDLFIKLGP